MIVTQETLLKDIEKYGGLPYHFNNIPTMCSVCGHRLTIPCIYLPTSKPLWVHMKCGEALANQLLFYVNNAETLKNNQQ